jgi:hypothetical protein
MIQDCAAEMLNAKRDDLDQSMAVPDMNSRFLLHGYIADGFRGDELAPLPRAPICSLDLDVGENQGCATR